MAVCQTTTRLNPEDIEALYPEGSAPEVHTDEPSATCSYGLTPYLLTGFLRQLLIQHFADPEQITLPELRSRLRRAGGWNNTAKTGIVIESITNWQPALADKRPAVLIRRHAWTWQKMAIGDEADVDERTGIVTYMGMWEGSHTLFALAEKAAEAEHLGCELGRIIVELSPLIRDSLRLHRFTPGNIGEAQEVEEVAEHYAVPVTMAYAAEEVWDVKPHAPRWKRLAFRASELLC